MDKDITDIVKSCKQSTDVLARPHQNSTIEWPNQAKKWSLIHVDHFFFQGKTFLVVIDALMRPGQLLIPLRMLQRICHHSIALTKYIECKIVQSTSAAETVDTLRVIFSRNGLPDTIVSDNAISFTAYEFKEFIENNLICHLTSPPYSPSSNGQGERAVRVVKDLLKKNVSGSLNNRLSNILLLYRSSPNSVTEMSPGMNFNGRNYTNVRERINLLHVPISVPESIRPNITSDSNVNDDMDSSTSLPLNPDSVTLRRSV